VDRPALSIHLDPCNLESEAEDAAARDQVRATGTRVGIGFD
jgi:hypothetical protein